MLIIKSPVGLKYNPCIVKSTDWFTERIRGNYSFINCAPGPEDLLHMVTLPAEIYVQEENNYIFSGDVLSYDRQSVKLEIVNNLLNRILVSDRTYLTWQDQVFITAVLKKLGVKDVREFMEQTREQMKETRQVKELTQLYWDRVWQLRQMSVLPGAEKDGGTPGETSLQEKPEKRAEVYYLHQAIFERLKSGAVYQEVGNFAANPVTDRRSIGAAETGIAGQTATAQHILLQKLKNTAFHTQTALTFNKTNIYELAGDSHVAQGEREALKMLAQAALFQLTTQLYPLYSQRQTAGRNSWYRFTNALYRSAENTWKRMEYFHSQNVNGADSLRSYVKKVNEHYRAETAQLKHLFSGEYEVRQPENGGQNSAEGTAAFREILRDGGSIPGETGELAGLPEQGRERIGKKEHPAPEGISALKEELDRWNERNIINLEKQLRKEETRERYQTKVDLKKSYADSLRALERPEEVLTRYLEEDNPLLRQTREEKASFYRQFSAETERIFRLLEKYREAPQLILKSGLVRTDAQESLQRDILLLKSGGDGADIVEEEQKRTGPAGFFEPFGHGPLEQEKSAVRTYPVKRQTEEKAETVRLGLTHRRTETTLLDEIRRETRSVQTKENRYAQEHEENSLTQRTVERKQTRVTDRTEEIGREDITRLVDKSIERQLPALTDEMIRRFERKLEGGMRRRGLNG